MGAIRNLTSVAGVDLDVATEATLHARECLRDDSLRTADELRARVMELEARYTSEPSQDAEALGRGLSALTCLAMQETPGMLAREAAAWAVIVLNLWETRRVARVIEGPQKAN